MDNKKHFMVDIETLSVAVNAAVLSIGAVEFDPFSGEIKNEFYHELRLDQQKHRLIDIGTVQWWVKQVCEDTTRGNIFLNENKTPVRNALLMLKEFFGGGEKAIWACDPDFDCTILSNLFNEYAIFIPWRYYEPKSVRTIRELAALHNVPMPGENKTHNALEDCLRQVKEVVEFNRTLNLQTDRIDK